MKIAEKQDTFQIVDFNPLEAYKIACKIEKDGIEFYESIRTGIKDERISRELELLIIEEREHLKFFEKRLFEVRQKIEDGFEEDDVLNYMDYGIFEPYRHIAGLADKIDKEKKALQLGIAIEEKSIKFYQACSAEVSSFQAKRELSNIIEEEKRHKMRFEDMLSRL